MMKKNLLLGSAKRPKNQILRPSPHPKSYFCLRTSDLNETFRVDVSWAWYLVVKISAQNLEPLEK